MSRSGGSVELARRLICRVAIDEYRDAPHASAALLQVGACVDEGEGLAVERDRLREHCCRQGRERRSLVGHELASFVTELRHRLGERAAAIEGEEDAIVVADDGAEVADDRHHPHRQRVVRGDVDAEERSAVFVVNVVVGDAWANALVLHAPAFPNDVLAGVRSHVVVDVEDAPLADGENAIGIEVRTDHLEVHEDPAEIGTEGIHQVSEGVRRWDERALKEQLRRRRAEPACSFERGLAEGERRDGGVEANPKEIGWHTVFTDLLRDGVKTETDEHRHH